MGTEHLPVRHFYAGDKIAIAGKPSAGIYFIEKGLVEIYTYRGGQRIHIAYIGKNEIIGEMGLIDGTLPSANIIVIEDTTCRFMKKSLLENRILNSDPFIRAILRLLARRTKRLLMRGTHFHR